ncbi:uncharacterized protein LOC118450356 [Vespa mandarinia]|uniref:uncharacterized protein LOC118450356 n=1 Tax=Vespa mandarinia TaxID=7446 RepID=UPI00161196A8|nr:uncharacterized protein LOC118450356 [Vespa mandarinia]XP_035741961.1 uncharacterized protein LOC118450356 [Vespa mandarinia]XP_035741962.1 uncharacterized protein LOC118450356 [Vespa mandarinia]XP_035741963.1 uncharacterized protein LOC118450356 [Vespa mandarinia]
MNRDIKRYTNIDYEKDDVMAQINKRFKYSQQGILDDIASSIESIAESMQSINENHSVFLEVNKALTLFLLKIEKKQKEKNFKEIESMSVKERLENTPSEGSI